MLVNQSSSINWVKKRESYGNVNNGLFGGDLGRFELPNDWEGKTMNDDFSLLLFEFERKPSDAGCARLDLYLFWSKTLLTPFPFEEKKTIEFSLQFFFASIFFASSVEQYFADFSFNIFGSRFCFVST